jgi:hypothetical protein
MAALRACNQPTLRSVVTRNSYNPWGCFHFHLLINQPSNSTVQRTFAALSPLTFGVNRVRIPMARQHRPNPSDSPCFFQPFNRAVHSSARQRQPAHKVASVQWLWGACCQKLVNTHGFWSHCRRPNSCAILACTSADGFTAFAACSSIWRITGSTYSLAGAGISISAPSHLC